MKTKIMEALQEFKDRAEEKGLIVYAVALKGSQNYNLHDEESDIDANLVFIPTPRELRSDAKYEIETENGKCTCHNIYQFATIVAKGNPQWIEICNTEYVIGDLSYFRKYKLNPSALKGMVMEKVTAFSKLYPSRAKYVEEFGYDPKQLHHIIRLYSCLLHNDPVYKYYGEARELMLDIKRGRFPESLKEAEKLRDQYIELINGIYEDRKLTYKVQPIDYDYLDSLLIKYYKEMKHL